MPHTRSALTPFCLIVLALATVTAALPARAATNGGEVTVSGWVIDSACAYTKGLDKPIGAACARACAKNGSPIVILRDDGTIFLPIDDKVPASSMNARLLPYAGTRVTVTGRDYDRKGSHGLVIEKISKQR